MLIHVIVKTRAREGRVERLDETHFQVAATEQPIDGKANKAVQKLLAKHLGIAPSQVILKKGQTSKYKTFEVIG